MVHKASSASVTISDVPRLGSSRAIIDFNTAATHEIIALAAGQKHKIVVLYFKCAGTVNVTLMSGANPMSGVMPFYAGEGVGFVAFYYALETNAGENFSITLSANVQVSGWCNYITEV
jgi:hypothetical protein